MTEPTIDEKQSYLRKEILEKGYDGEQFLSYLQSIKGPNADDLSLWKIEDLQVAVFKFISSQPSPSSDSILNNEILLGLFFKNHV